MNYIYLYSNIKNRLSYLKYGIKLSEHADIVINLNDLSKKGIQAFLSPKDSILYDNEDYICFRISTTNLNIYVFENTFINSFLINDTFYKLSDYKIGTFKDPICLICSSILPENIFIYDKLIDMPLLVQNSKEFHINNSINNILDALLLENESYYDELLNIAIKSKLIKLVKSDKDNFIYKDKSNNLYFKKM